MCSQGLVCEASVVVDMVISRYIYTYGFALTWNYWFGDAVTVGSDLVTLRLLLRYWMDHFPGWALSLIFWFALMAVSILTVRAYGEVSRSWEGGITRANQSTA